MVLLNWRHISCSWKLCVIFVVLEVSIGKVSATCEDASTNFTCTNSNIVPCSYYRDGRNDCVDNSDEGVLYTCREIGSAWQFKCTMEALADGSVASCQVQAKIYDQYADCADYSDEKLYVGDTCVDIINLESTTGCELFMTESYCNSTNQCDCRSGTYASARNVDCIVRVIGDSCSILADCVDASSDYQCLNDTCQCNTGYIANADGVACDWIQLGNNCTFDDECTTSISNTECSESSNSTCQCQYTYIAESTTACNPRVFGDTCETDIQCSTHMGEFGLCNSGVCDCMDGSYSSGNGSQCTQVFLTENCTDNLNCSQISYAECSNGTCSCVNTTLLYDYLGKDCAFGLGDLYCDSDDNCTAQFNNSQCNTNNICECQTGHYEDGYYDCTQFQIGDACTNDTDCSLITNADCYTFADNSSQCTCFSGYVETGQYTCGIQESSCTSFICRQPWAIALIIIALLGLIAIAVVVVLLVLKKIKISKVNEMEEGIEEKYRTKSAKKPKGKVNSVSSPGKVNGVASPGIVSVTGIDTAVITQRPPTATSASKEALSRGRLMTPVEKTRSDKAMSANPTKKKKKGKKVKKAISETDLPTALDPNGEAE